MFIVDVGQGSSFALVLKQECSILLWLQPYIGTKGLTFCFLDMAAVEYLCLSIGTKQL